MITNTEETQTPRNPNQEYKQGLIDAVKKIKEAETDEEALAIISGVGTDSADRFAKTLAHVFNNQLTLIDGGIELLKMGADPKQADTFIDPGIAKLTDIARRLGDNSPGEVILHSAGESVSAGSLDIDRTFTIPRNPSNASTDK